MGNKQIVVDRSSAKTDILVLSWLHLVKIRDDDVEPSDPIWEALAQTFGIPPSARPLNYDRNFTDVLADLLNWKVVQKDRGRLWFLYPQLRNRFGQYHTFRFANHKVSLFRSELRLNTDGPTLPVLRMLRQLIVDASPKLVLSVGLGGGVTSQDCVGDVIVSSSARFQLRGEFESSDLNGQTFEGDWHAEKGWFRRLKFEALQEPELIPISSFYEMPPKPIQPPPHVPEVRISKKPLLTSPFLTEHRFTIGTSEGKGFLGELGSAIEMDSAPVAMVCNKEHVKCGFVTGICVPALVNYRYDFQSTLQKAWADLFVRHYATSVAANCSRVIKEIARRPLPKPN